MKADNIIGVVLCTVGNVKNAELIAKTLVETGKAACVNIIKDISSVYKWENKICQDEELLLIIKTRSGLFEYVKAKIIELHEYTLPEIIFLPVEKAHEEYLKWILKETQND